MSKWRELLEVYFKDVDAIINNIYSKAVALIYPLENGVGRSPELIKATENLKAAVRTSREKAYNIKGEHVGYTYTQDGQRYFETIKELRK